jgi:ABC-type dipeptide/oligopeptide/nickel transport system permease component
VLPVLVISAGGIAYFTKMIYELVTDEVRKPYAIAVLARGISFDRLVFRHVLRNIAVPVLVSGFSTFASFIGSSIVMEYLFSIPGSGQLIMQACTEGDYPLVQGVVLFSGIFVLLSFIASDLIALFADPRAAASNGIKQVQG